jgi:hypothetical protein
MLDLAQLRELLATRFSLERTHRSLQSVLSDVGLAPSHIHFDRRTGHGRVGYYDPLVCWALLTALESQTARRVLRSRLKSAFRRASDAVWQEYPAGVGSAPGRVVNEWQWRCGSTAIHLFISDPRHGLHPYRLMECRLRGLTEITLDSPECLGATFSIYSEQLARLPLATAEEMQRLAVVRDDSERVRLVLGSLDSFGVLRASDRRLGPGPHVADRA